MKIYKDYSLLPYNAFGMDVKAARFVEYDSVEELTGFLAGHEDVFPCLHVGGGSNLLFTADYAGTVLHSAIKGREIVGETEDWVDIRVGAGEVWDDFVAYAVACGWYGAENLSLIPGEVGASAVQNIGAYGVEAKDLIRFVDTVCLETGCRRRFANEECCYSYRESVFKKELKGKYIVTHVTFRLGKRPAFRLDYGNIQAELGGAEPTLEGVRQAVIRIRRAKLPDPKLLGNGGSFFMNPVVPAEQFEALAQRFPDMPCYPVAGGRVKIPAGWLIDRCGWKGKSIGRAAVYERQALVLVNLGGASGKEILQLAQAVAHSVKDKFGVTIAPEVNII